ncbi:hypothetical protein BCR35DRAFT_335498 [Leucosporidium creatinivorum]|uniref:Uncharacterized protein n=1 Tax=Leucosporidium creatinivorum TaxID=106004 RepID=A0A1Y2DBZ2_9BASI|nr:hypothetical protein BCR35DRAFT_335498 [Leucosporidium creatinivorum]
MASTTPFASPLGPLHFAPPSTMSCYSLTSLFRTPKASISRVPSPPSAPKRRKDKRSSKGKATLEISSPIKGTSFITYEDYCRGSATELSSPPPPPPYRLRAESTMGTEEDLEYAEDAEEEVEQLEEKEKLSIEEMQQRLEQWEQERMETKRASAIKQDRRMGDELRALGL